MVVLRAIGAFFAKIGRWIRDTAWVQPLLIVGGIFAIIFSIPNITSWVQSWFVTGDEAISFYKNTNHLSLTNGEKDGKNSDADKLLQFIFATDEADRDYSKYGEKFFVTFVQEDCSTCKTIYKGWQSAKDSWGREAGFKKVEKKDGDDWTEYATAGEFKMYTIFIDEVNEDDDDKNYFQELFDNVYADQFGRLSTLLNPYSSNNGVDYSNIANSGSTDLSGGSVFTSPTTLLFDKNFAPNYKDDGYACDGNSIAKFHISEILYDIPSKGTSGTNLEKARTVWDCWHHIGTFDNRADDIYRSL